jgi:hypothetical protein
MNNPHITYLPHPDATPQSELSALVAAYRFVIFDCNAKKKGARPGARDDAERLNNDRTDTRIIPE